MSEIPAPTSASSGTEVLSIADRLQAANLALTNTANSPALATALSAYGYNTTRLDEGRALLDTAQTLTLQQAKEYGEQYAATDALDVAQLAANRFYIRHLELARLAFKGNRDAANALDLANRRKKDLSGWIQQAKQFYTTLLNTPEFKTGLAVYNRTEAELMEGRDLVLAVEAANFSRAKERGEAQQATQARDVALETLDDWMSDFITVARLACADDPQLLEQLGLVVKAS